MIARARRRGGVLFGTVIALITAVMMILGVFDLILALMHATSVEAVAGRAERMLSGGASLETVQAEAPRAGVLDGEIAIDRTRCYPSFSAYANATPGACNKNSKVEIYTVTGTRTWFSPWMSEIAGGKDLVLQAQFVRTTDA